MVDIDEATARKAANELDPSGERIAVLCGDVSNSARMAEIASEVARRFGRVDILVNNAGINTRKDRRPIHEYSDDDWQAILRVDLTGVFVTSRGVIPHMLRSGGGRMVHIAAVAGAAP